MFCASCVSAYAIAYVRTQKRKPVQITHHVERYRASYLPERTAALDNALDGLVEITPPTEFVGAHNRFIDGLAQFAVLSQAIALETQNLETDADVISLAAHPVFGIGPSNEIEEVAVEACRFMQKRAEAKDVAMNLACEELS